MTTFAAKYIQSLEDQTRYRLDQAAREAAAVQTARENAIERWAELFAAGLYSEARRMWWSNVERTEA